MCGQHRRASAIVAALASLLVMTAGTVGAQAAQPTACHVRNADTGAIYSSFGQAVAVAAPGAELVVRGTCVSGTTVIGAPIVLRGIRRGVGVYDTGPARVMAGTRGPALRIDPAVDALDIDQSLTIVGGVVIGAGPRRVAKEAGMSWSHRGRVHFVRRCDVLGGDADLASVVVSSSAGSRVSFLGRCQGPLVIDAAITIVGSRLATSVARDSHGAPIVVGGTDTGRPSVRRPGPEPAIIVSPAVDSLRLVAFRIHDGLRIGNGVSLD